MAILSNEYSREDEREGAEIVYGAEACYHQSTELLEKLGFPKGILALKDIEECGRVHKTGFIWMKQKSPIQHFFEGTNTQVSYAKEVTAYLEKNRMKKISGVKCKQVYLWVPIVEMISFDDDLASRTIQFKTPLGIRKSFPATAFMSHEEKNKYLEKPNCE
ncbi:hypothetical protein Vadar_029003 [Vaccinium darrowii]|uniref:Uncharacterized protein n=1 Tax=Vaccinium darrowii TaxID=229202 RepID=A0ACB7XKV5_9ERIC|nr:hypothetical protein Vadar_029003 [Vaccinium darrowii]